MPRRTAGNGMVRKHWVAWGLAVGGALGLLLAGVWWARTQRVLPVQKRMQFLMDTSCTVSVPGGKDLLPVIDRIFERVQEIDRKFNCLNPESPVYAFNEKNQPIQDPELVRVIQAAVQVSEQSQGALDITVYPLMRLWGFVGSDKPRVPHPDAIKACLRRVGYCHLEIKNGRVSKRRPDVQVDLGGIAKGYAVGVAAQMLRDAGVRSGLVDFGGDLYAVGELHHRAWRAGVRDPSGEGVVGVIKLTDMSTATSGDYERFFEEQGIRYHHILDPRTGYPARGVKSVTVVTPDAMLGDAWSTAFFVLGADVALRVAKTLPGTEIICITQDNHIHYSPHLESRVTFHRDLPPGTPAAPRQKP